MHKVGQQWSAQPPLSLFHNINNTILGINYYHTVTQLLIVIEGEKSKYFGMEGGLSQLPPILQSCVQIKPLTFHF